MLGQMYLTDSPNILSTTQCLVLVNSIVFKLNIYRSSTIAGHYC